MSNKALVSIVVAAAVLLGVMYFVAPKLAQRRGNEGRTEPAITGFTIVKPYLVANSTGMAKMEAWYVPTGTGVNEDAHQKLGDMADASESPSSQAWRIEIPKQPFLATEIYAKGFDASGTEYRKSLSVTGATDIYNALWMEVPAKEQGLRPGESMEFEGVTVTFNKVVSDSRCPANANCVWAGNVVANAGIAGAGKDGTYDIASDKGVEVGNYFISIPGVSPERGAAGSTITDYSLTFRIERNIKL